MNIKSVYLSHASLRKWADGRVLAEGRSLFDRGYVQALEEEDGMIQATVTSSRRAVRTQFRVLEDGTVESHCPCRLAQERGLICDHVVAAGYMLADLTEDAVLERRKRIEVLRNTRIPQTHLNTSAQRSTDKTKKTVPRATSSSVGE